MSKLRITLFYIDGWPHPPSIDASLEVYANCKPGAEREVRFEGIKNRQEMKQVISKRRIKDLPALLVENLNKAGGVARRETYEGYLEIAKYLRSNKGKFK